MYQKKFPVKAFVLFAFMLAGSAYAQTYTGSEAKKISKKSQKVIFNPNRNSIDFVEFDEGVNAGGTERNLWLKEQIAPKESNTGFVLYRKDNDQIGFSHYRYKQTYKGIPVEDGVYYIHEKNNTISSINGEFYSGIVLNNTTPSLDKTLAFNKALAHVNAKKYIWNTSSNKNDGFENQREKTELVIFKTEKGFALAYKCNVYATQPLSRQNIYVDAKNGKILKTRQLIHTTDANGTAVTAYNGIQTITTDSAQTNSFFLRESGRNIETLNFLTNQDFFDADNYWNNTTDQDNYATDAHWGTEKTYDFYLSRFNRHSLDDAGMTLFSYVHETSVDVNAFWDGSSMHYGDGDFTQGYTPLTSLEIVGHELTHGVTEYSAALVYDSESGALNEAFSDIFGATIRFTYSPNVANWYIGDQIVIPNSAGIPFRNMANPNEFQCPDTYGGTYFDPNNDVHYNSGIANYWYYLICDGGAGTNDLGNNYSVSPIGLTDASSIAYRTLTTYLTPNATFLDARTYSEQASFDLFGPCANQTIQVARAWYAVGVGGTPSFVKANFTAPSTFSCSAPLTVNFVNQSLNAGIYSWTFGDGQTSTVTTPSNTYATPGTYNVKLVAHGTGACSNFSDSITKTAFVNIGQFAPHPAFGYQPDPAFEGIAVNFTDSTLYGPSSWSWDFGDGNSASTQNPVHTYSSSGTYSVKLVVTNCYTTDSITELVDVKKLNILCTDTLSTDSIGRVFDSGGLLGNYGNNENCSFTIAPSCFASINFTIDSAKFAYGDTLFVYDGNYLIDWIYDSVPSYTQVAYSDIKLEMHSYSSTPEYGFSAKWVANPLTSRPTADFYYYPYEVSPGDSLTFTDYSYYGVNSWLWDFGDGSTSTQKNPTHAYNAEGTYDVTLIVSNCLGADTALYSIDIKYVLMCTDTSNYNSLGKLYDSGGSLANYGNNENCQLAVMPNCSDSTEISFTSFDLKAGDTLYIYDGVNEYAPLLLAASGNSLPADVHAESGNFFVKMLSDESNVGAGFCLNWSSAITYTKPVVADFVSYPTTFSAFAPVYFYDLSASGIWYREWEFDNDATNLEYAINPVHTFSTEGTHTVKLKVYGCNGAIDSVTKTININSNGVTEIKHNDSFVIYPNPAQDKIMMRFENSSNAELFLYNYLGEQLDYQSVNGSSAEINSSHLPSGYYIIELHSKNEFIRKPVQIIR